MSNIKRHCECNHENCKVCDIDLQWKAACEPKDKEIATLRKALLFFPQINASNLKKNNAQLVDTLFGFIGVTDLSELRDMLEIMKTIPDPEGHSVIAIEAINCLLNIGAENE